MSYETVDPIFSKWAQRHSLQVFTEYKDEAIRMTRIYSSKPRVHRGRVEIPHAGISLFPVQSGKPIYVGVGASRRPSRNSKYVKLEATIETLDEVLERAYRQAAEWLVEGG
jgi:hypothetical protein